MTKETFVTLRSVGVKGNRAISRASTGRKAKLVKPTNASLKELGYTASQREIILANL